MKKNQSKRKPLFEYLEKKVLEDVRTRRPLTEEEVKELDNLLQEKGKLKGAEKLDEEKLNRLKELQRLNSYIKPGEKHFIMSRNTAKPKKGKRFVYLGADGDFHISRLGGTLKVPMATK